MRTVEEIKADIASCDSEWIDSALCRSLRCELYETILGGIPLDRLEAICAAEKDGRCVTLPCKVGDIVYLTIHGYVEETKVRTFFVGHPSYSYVPFDPRYYMVRLEKYDIPLRDVGKTVFLTRADAEKSLGKEQGHDD